MDLNKAMIIGRITQQPEARVVPSGQSVSSFSVATNRVWTDQQGQKQERVEFHNIVAWGKLAEICNQYLQKGKKIYLEGRLQTRDWVGQDGVKRYRTEIVAENMIMLDRMDGGGAGQGYQRPRVATPTTPSSETSQTPNEPEIPTINADEPASPTPDTSNDDIKVEDIPF